MEPDSRHALYPNGPQVSAANTHTCLKYRTFDTLDLIYPLGEVLH